MLSINQMFGKKKRITVSVTAYGLATRLIHSGRYEIKEGSTVKALLRQAGLTDMTAPLVYMIQGQRVDPGHRLEDGATLKIMQMAGGG